MRYLKCHGADKNRKVSPLISSSFVFYLKTKKIEKGILCTNFLPFRGIRLAEHTGQKI